MYKVLIVDDEPLVIHGLSRQVDWESLNMELSGTATNGHDILAMMVQNPAHLLITDVSMPDMDGLTLISRAKAINPSLRCIIISAFSEFEYVKKALKLGVENYLLKPINESEFQDTLSKTLENLIRDQMDVFTDSPDALAFRNNILERWVNGAIQDFELYERAELLNINLAAAEYAVCVMDIVHPRGKDFKFRYSQILLKLCRRVLLPAFRGECFPDNACRIVVILHGEALAPRQKELESALRRLGEEAAAQGMRVFSSVSPATPASSSVGAAFAAAVFYLNYRFVDPSAAVVFCRNLHTDENQTILIQFKTMLKDGNLQQAQLLAAKYFERHANASFPEAHDAMLTLVLSLVRAAIVSGRIADELPAAIRNQLAFFASIGSSELLQAWLARTIDDAIQVIGERKSSLHLLVHLTLKQVNEQYGSELSLKTLATGFNVNPAYLGQLFKEETGKYFNDFLTQVRLQASRALLLETDMKIGEIVQRVGIPNQSYFNRVFKKIYGISPLEFRRQGLKS